MVASKAFAEFRAEAAAAGTQASAAPR